MDTELEDMEATIREVLVHSELWVGGSPGVCVHQRTVYTVMQKRGLLGKKFGLTRKGMAEGRKAYRAYWGDEEI